MSFFSLKFKNYEFILLAFDLFLFVETIPTARSVHCLEVTAATVKSVTMSTEFVSVDAMTVSLIVTAKQVKFYFALDLQLM